MYGVANWRGQNGGEYENAQRSELTQRSEEHTKKARPKPGLTPAPELAQ